MKTPCIDESGHAFPMDDAGWISDCCRKCGYIDPGGPVHYEGPILQPPPLTPTNEGPSHDR